MRKEMPSVSVITVNYNGKQFLNDCFKSLLNLNYPKNKLEILMVDNGSQDGSLDYVRKKFPTVKVIIDSKNNYAKANNLGIKTARGEYIALINNDVKVDKNWLITLVRTAQEDITIGAVGSKILFMDGSIQSVGHQEYPNFYWGDIGFKDKDDIRYGLTKEVVSICGCSVLYRRKCLKDVGLLDEDFNMFMEDVDMGIRCRKKGWKLVTCPESILYHKFHGSIGSEENARYWQETNRLFLIVKHWPEKLPDALSGEDYFTVKNGYSNEKDISTVLGKVFVKLIKEHGLEFTNKLSSNLFNVVRRIYNFEKDHLIQVAKDQEITISQKTQEITLKNQETNAKDQELSLKEHKIASLQQDMESLKQQKDQEIAAKNQELSIREQRLASIGRDLISVKQEISNKDQQLTSLMQDLESLRQQKDQEIENKIQYINEIEKENVDKAKQIKSIEQERNNLSLWLVNTRRELQSIYNSTGYKYLLKPLWDFLWLIKNNFKKIENHIVDKKSSFKVKQIKFIGLINKSFKLFANIKNSLLVFSSGYSLKRIYLNHLKFKTLPVMPKKLILLITRNCNLRCEFCDIAKVEQKTKIMRKEEAFKIIDSAFHLGIKEIELTGGEPLLHPDVFEIAKYSHSRNMKVLLTTNGILVKSNIQKILDSKFSFISISIDGEETTHDALRNYQGAYKLAVEAIDLLKQHKVETAINFVVTNKNIYELEKVYNYFFERNINLVFFPVINRPELFLSKAVEIKMFLKFIKKLYYKSRISVYEYNYLKDAVLVYFGKKGTPVRCLGLNREIGIDTDGAISPCCVWENRKGELNDLGNLFKSDLEELWFSSKFCKARLSIFSEGCQNCFNPSIYELTKLTGINYLVRNTIKFHNVMGISIPKYITKPSHVHFRFTSRCNLSCRHCDIWKIKTDYNKELSVHQWQECIDKLSNWLGKFRLDLAGGEILLYKEAINLIRHCANRDIEVNLTTNATMINDETAKRLVDSGLYAINLSLDGLDRIHEFTRNQKGIYSKVQNAAFALVKYRSNNKPYIVIATVITKYNLEELGDIIKLVDDWGIDGVNFQILDHNFGAQYFNDWFKNNEFWPDDYNKVENVFGKIIQAKKSGTKIYNSLVQLNDMREYYRDPIKIAEHKCTSGNKNFIVDEFGGIRLCWNMEPIGDIIRQDPKKVWYSKLAFQKRKEIYACRRTCRILNCNY